MRAYTEGNEVGGFMAKEADFMGADGKMLSASEIQSKFALPNRPTDIADVNVPAGFKMRAGQAGENAFGAGGGTQYQALDEVKPEMISNAKKLTN